MPQERQHLCLSVCVWRWVPADHLSMGPAQETCICPGHGAQTVTGSSTSQEAMPGGHQASQIPYQQTAWHSVFRHRDPKLKETRQPLITFSCLAETLLLPCYYFF